jgi:hypothetical protein
MNVRMVLKILSPGMQHAQKTYLGAKMLWIGGDLAQCLRGSLEQNVVDDRLVLKRDDLDLLGNCEHHMVVRHEFRLAVLEPPGPRETLALRTVSISARVVRHTLMTAIIALLDVTAESGGAATLNRDHGAPPRGGQRCAMLITECRAEVAEHIRHFQSLARHGTRRQAGTRSGTVGAATSSVSKGLTVAHTLSVAIMRYRAVVPRLR